MFLIGVDPAYQKLGANVLIFNELIKAYQKNGVKYVSTGPMLEENRSVLNLWNEFGDQLDPVDIRRRCFQKNISE
jgi:GNAT superfamily N-acetyltransferase